MWWKSNAFIWENSQVTLDIILPIWAMETNIETIWLLATNMMPIEEGQCQVNIGLIVLDMILPMPMFITENQYWANVGHQYGRGINREGFNFKLDMVKMCSTWPLLNKYALWKFVEVGLQTDTTVISDPYSAFGKSKILKIWILFLQWSEYIPIHCPINLKHQRHLMKTLRGFTYPIEAKCDKSYHFRPITATWYIKRDHGVCRSYLIFV